MYVVRKKNNIPNDRYIIYIYEENDEDVIYLFI